MKSLRNLKKLLIMIQKLQSSLKNEKPGFVPGYYLMGVNS